MSDSEPKSPYIPTEKRRFELSRDDFSKERVRGLLKAHRTLKEEVPFFAGMTLFGSLSKGKELTEDTATFADIDLMTFIDEDVYEQTIDQFERENGKFREKLEYVFDEEHASWVPGGTRTGEARPRNVQRAAELYIEDRIRDIVITEVKNQELPREKIKTSAEFISAREDDETRSSIFAAVAFHDYWMENHGHMQDAELASFQAIAAPFFFDIGGGLTKYRRAFMNKLVSLSPEEADKYWKTSVTAMKAWERKNNIPESLVSTYPETFAEAREYYSPNEARKAMEVSR